MTGRDVITDFHRRAAADEDRLLELRRGRGAGVGGRGRARPTPQEGMLATDQARATLVHRRQ